MTKREIFIAAMHLKHYKRLAWIVSAFSLAEQKEDWLEHAQQYDLFQNHMGHFYVNENKQLVLIEDAQAGVPLFSFDEQLQITQTDCPNAPEGELTTCYGNLLFNWVALVECFDTNIPYQSGPVVLKKVSDLIIKKLTDDPETDLQRQPDRIYIKDYLKFSEAMFFLTGLSQLCVWAATKKTILPPPGIKEYREKLLKENEGHLHELATIAKIDKALVEYDAQWLKGDPGGEKFIPGGKARSVVRKKKFLMHGAEVGMDESSVHGTLVQNSLYEGWDVSKFPEMNNSLRNGSFNRGAQTMLGGVSVKWLLRASSNMQISKDDCGSTLGSPTLISEENKNKYIGFTAIVENSQEKLTEESIGKYLGKSVMIRNPMYCKLTFTDYCKVCSGDRLSVNPYGLSIAVSDYGSSFLSLFMRAMHGKQLKTAKLSLEASIF